MKYLLQFFLSPSSLWQLFLHLDAQLLLLLAGVLISIQFWWYFWKHYTLRECVIYWRTRTKCFVSCNTMRSLLSLATASMWKIQTSVERSALGFDISRDSWFTAMHSNANQHLEKNSWLRWSWCLCSRCCVESESRQAATLLKGLTSLPWHDWLLQLTVARMARCEVNWRKSSLKSQNPSTNATTSAACNGK